MGGEGAGGGSTTAGSGGTAGGSAGGGSAGGGGGGAAFVDAGQLTLLELCQGIAKNSCDCYAALGRLPQGTATCLMRTTNDCLAAPAELFDAGRLAFDGFAAKRCLEVEAPQRANACIIESLPCSGPYQRGDIYPRIGGAGALCNERTLCGPGHFCPAAGEPVCAACQPLRVVGQACDETAAPCDPVAIVDKSPLVECIAGLDGGRVCLTRSAPPGEYCSAERGCELPADGGRIRCVGSRCVGPPAVGGDCRDFGSCAAGGACRFDGGSYTCTPTQAAGAPCTSFLDCDSQLCGLALGASQRTCLAAGAPCAVDAGSACGGRCVPQAVGASGRCYAAIPDGELCSAGASGCLNQCLLDYGSDGGSRHCATPTQGLPCRERSNCGNLNCVVVDDAGAGVCAGSSVPEGEGCVRPLDELQGNCSGNGELACVGGICRTLAPHSLARGAMCTRSLQCPEADYCNGAMRPRVCAPRLEADAGCPYGDECRWGLSCIRGACTPPGGDGVACSPTGISRDCQLYTVCIDQRDGGSRCRPWVENGGTCGPNSTLGYCSDGWCGGGAVCEPRFDAGAPCWRYDQCTCGGRDGGNSITGDGGVCRAPTAICR
ncbi:MAG: hypothetical protein JNK82_13920 [Myxococcaceae bacterium]|nr:hypothetical protein [Myxococcaceae bacterium]